MAEMNIFLFLEVGGSCGSGPPPPPPLWGTPKLHKEGRNVVCMHTNTPRFSTEHLPGPSPPLSKILYPPLHMHVVYTQSDNFNFDGPTVIINIRVNHSLSHRKYLTCWILVEMYTYIMKPVYKCFLRPPQYE